MITERQQNVNIIFVMKELQNCSICNYSVHPMNWDMY